MFKRRESKEEGLGIYSRIPMTQTPHTWASSDNRRIWLYTSVYNIFFSLFLPSMNGTIYTQSRYGSQFVSSPFSALLSVLSKECRVLFIQTIQSSIYFFPSSLFLLGLLFGLKGRVKTKPPIRICLHNGDVVETQCNNTDRLLIFRNFSIIFIEFGLSNRMFFSLLKKKICVKKNLSSL